MLATAREGLLCLVLMQQRSLRAIRMTPTRIRTGPVILSCVVLKPCCSPMPIKTKVVPMDMRARPMYKNISTLHFSFCLSTFIVWTKFKFFFKISYAVLPELKAVPLDASKLQRGQTTVVPKIVGIHRNMEKSVLVVVLWLCWAYKKGKPNYEKNFWHYFASEL